MALMITNLSRIAIEYATSITGTKKLEWELTGHAFNTLRQNLHIQPQF